jgi:hypothetical protein
LEHHHGSRAGFEDTFKMNLSVCRFDDGWREIGFAQAIGKVCLCRIVSVMGYNYQDKELVRSSQDS